MMEAEVLHKKKMLAPKLRFKDFTIEWKNKKVGELCDSIVPGRNKPTNFEGNIPWITTPDIIHNGVVFHSKNGLVISKEEAKKVGSKIVPVNSVIISCVGDLGLAATNGIEVVINQQLHAFIPKEFINYKFLLYGLSIQKKYMEKVATKTAVPYMNKENCNSIPIVHPTLPEQEKIASFLSAVDEKIQQLTRKKELLEQYKKGVMQQLFSGKLRFKDENGNAFPKWEEKKLGDITTLLKDGTHGTHKDYPDGNHYLLSAKNIINGSIKIEDTDRRISKEDYNSIYKNYKLVENDLLLTIVGTIGRVAIYKHEKNIAFQRSVAFFRFKDQSADFLFQLMNETKFQKQLDLRKVISAQPGIYLGDLAKIPVKLPCIDEQKKIADYLSNIDNKIESVTKQITQTQTFKKSLLQQMFV